MQALNKLKEMLHILQFFISLSTFVTLSFFVRALLLLGRVF